MTLAPFPGGTQTVTVESSEKFCDIHLDGNFIDWDTRQDTGLDDSGFYASTFGTPPTKTEAVFDKTASGATPMAQAC